jgi:hypothetical protein
MLQIDPNDVVNSQWVDNGLGWLGVLMDSAEAVLALRPGVVDLDIGVLGRTQPAHPRPSRSEHSSPLTA